LEWQRMREVPAHGYPHASELCCIPNVRWMFIHQLRAGISKRPAGCVPSLRARCLKRSTFPLATRAHRRDTETAQGGDGRHHGRSVYTGIQVASREYRTRRPVPTRRFCRRRTGTADVARLCAGNVFVRRVLVDCSWYAGGKSVGV
jgi:hypothetical protein